MAAFSKKLHLLVVEDDETDFLLIRDFLEEEEGTPPSIKQAKTFASAKRYLSNNFVFDAILLDISLPDAFGKMLVSSIIELAETTPIIVLTAYADKQFALNAIKLGVTDYLLKDELTPSLLNKSLTYAIERKHIYSELKQSEQKYKELFQANPQPMWVYDMETFRFLSVNEAAIRDYGFTREEFLDMTIKDIRPLEDVDKVVKDVAFNRVNQEFSKGIFRHIKKSGEIISVEIKSNSIDFEGRKARLILSNDITEKLEAERTLKFRENRFKALVQDGSDLIGILDLEGNYKYVSPTTATILGVAAEEYIGKNAFDFIHEADKAEVLKQFSLLSTKNRIYIQPFRFKDADNNWRWIETVITNMMHDPAVEGIVANSRDVTERRDYIEAIEEQNRRLREIAWMQSHLVRAPLARILGIVELFNTHTKVEFNTAELLGCLKSSANELDGILRKIVEKTDMLNQYKA